MKNKKILIGIVIIVAFIVTYLVSTNYVRNKDVAEDPKIEQVPKGDKKDVPVVPKEDEKKQVKEDITFLVLGVDEGERSDNMMVCKYFGSTGKISILSIPRDTRTEVAGHGLDKINHAHAYGGHDLSLEAVNNLLNMNIEYYVRVDYNLLKEVVDTIDGIDIFIPETKDFWSEGMHKLYGEEALEFVRYRTGYYNQDFGRMASQQEFLKQILVKMKETKSIVAFTKMIKSGMDNIDTNISKQDMLSYGLELKNIDTSKLKMETLPGESQRINGISYVILYEDQIPKILEDLFENDEVNKENKD